MCWRIHVLWLEQRVQPDLSLLGARQTPAALKARLAW